MELKVIITGTTGMVGEGVLMKCLEHPLVKEVLSVSRKSSGKSHPKLKEYIVSDFLNLQKGDEKLAGYNACFYCAGISSLGMDESAYSLITYDTTIHFAEILSELNPEMTFNFVSGSHTDGTERGKVMWARVKGKTENALQHIPFKQVYSFRPALMKPTKGQVHLKGYNKAARFLYPFFKLFFPGSSLEEIGLAMINAVTKGYSKKVLEVKDIKFLAKS